MSQVYRCPNKQLAIFHIAHYLQTFPSNETLVSYLVDRTPECDNAELVVRAILDALAEIGAAMDERAE